MSEKTLARVHPRKTQPPSATPKASSLNPWGNRFTLVLEPTRCDLIVCVHTHLLTSPNSSRTSSLVESCNSCRTWVKRGCNLELGKNTPILYNPKNHINVICLFVCPILHIACEAYLLVSLLDSSIFLWDFLSFVILPQTCFWNGFWWGYIWRC